MAHHTDTKLRSETSENQEPQHDVITVHVYEGKGDKDLAFFVLILRRITLF